MASARASELKEEGNMCFTSADYVGAEALYSKAINIDPTNPLLYTNRAMARIKLKLYEAVIPDCLSSLELLSENMKAHYYLAQAELELGRLEDAYQSASLAYELCSGSKTGVVDRAWERSRGQVTALVLRCKKELWERQEVERLRTWNSLRDEVDKFLERRRNDEKEGINVDGDATKEELDRVDKEWADKGKELKRIWDVAADADSKRRDVPDWAIDNITFAVMQDPVMTKNGQSYERASIEEHLGRSPTDPLTREPLRVEDLRPNLGLKAACAEFLKNNGWAVDW